MFRSPSRRAFLQLGLPLWLAGCGSDEGAPPPSQASVREVELLSWWVAASELDALDALLRVHRERYPDDRIRNTTYATGTEAQQKLYEQISAGTPPDLYQENAYDLPELLKAQPGCLASLAEFFDREGLNESVVPEVLQAVTVDGVVRAMPVNIHRENTLLYNKKVFDELGLALPTTLDELLATCDSLKAAGVTPIATQYTGWIQRILFNGLNAARMGSEAFAAFFTGKGEVDEAELRKSIALLDRVLNEYVNDTAADPERGWTDAANLLRDGKAGMFIHGDWAKGYLVELGLIPGFDFGVIGMPGASDLFLYGVDVFAMLEDAASPEPTLRFLDTVGSKEGQIAFNKLKGSTPIRLDVDLEQLDPAGQATLEDLRHAKVRLLTRSKTAWDAALERFATDRDADALVAAYLNDPPGS